MIYQSISELVGSTPIIKLNNIIKKHHLKANLFGKLEWFNPTGSIKDRIAKEMLDDAYQKGSINEDTTIIEATSGNTGISLASLCASRGYKLIITMPDNMSEERKRLLNAFGAKLILTDASKGMQGAIAEAKTLHAKMPNSFIISQFTNEANPLAHYKTTGPEIYQAMQGKIDICVMGVGSGGTITGVGEYLKRQNPHIKIIAVEPASSAVLSGNKAGTHNIQGLGAGFIPQF